MRIWERVHALCSANNAPFELSPDNSINESAASVVEDLDDFLTDMYGGTLSTLTHNSKTVDSIRQQIKMLEIEPRQPHTCDVWKHWLARKASHPELFAVAMVVLSAPSNQASVERAFSALALVLTSHRTGMADDLLENTLLVKLNQPIVEKVMPTLYPWKDFKENINQ